MPDHPCGYTTRATGYLAPNERVARAYGQTAKHGKVFFEADLQRWMIDELIKAQRFIDTRLHIATTESTHIHFLVSWSGDRTWESVRSSLRTSVTRRVRAELQLARGAPGNRKPPIFSDGGSRRHVSDRSHFNHLVGTYLPSHSGWLWHEDAGWRELRE